MLKKESSEFVNNSENTETEPPQNSFKMLFLIVQRGKADVVEELLDTCGIKYHLNCQGTGTASSRLLEILGLGDSQKDVILSLVESSKTENLLKNINDNLRASGVAFTVNLSSFAGIDPLHLLKGDKNENE